MTRYCAVWIVEVLAAMAGGAANLLYWLADKIEGVKE